MGAHQSQNSLSAEERGEEAPPPRSLLQNTHRQSLREGWKDNGTLELIDMLLGTSGGQYFSTVRSQLGWRKAIEITDISELKRWQNQRYPM